MNSLYSEKEVGLMELKSLLRAWEKESKNKDSKYSDFFIFKQIDLIRAKIKEIEGKYSEIIKKGVSKNE